MQGDKAGVIRVTPQPYVAGVFGGHCHVAAPRWTNNETYGNRDKVTRVDALVLITGNQNYRTYRLPVLQGRTALHLDSH